MTARAGEVRNKGIWSRRPGGDVADQSRPSRVHRLLRDLGGCQGLWKTLYLGTWQ